jgi:hypothetical protein
MQRLGANRARVAVFLAVEAGFLLAVALAVAVVLAGVAPMAAPVVLRVASGA